MLQILRNCGGESERETSAEGEKNEVKLLYQLPGTHTNNNKCVARGA